MDEERIIEPEPELPEGATWNGYREYDLQDLILKRHNIRFLLAEYVTVEGNTIVGKLPDQYRGHYGPTLISFTLYQHHQCRVPQNLILEQHSHKAIKLVTEVALLGSAIEHGLSPLTIVLSDGAKQFAILAHALCWVHMERSLRRLNGVTAQQRQEIEIEQVQDTLWDTYLCITMLLRLTFESL